MTEYYNQELVFCQLTSSVAEENNVRELRVRSETINIERILILIGASRHRRMKWRGRNGA